MLKFFRNVRGSLLSDNQTGRYLKYAIGEVILVTLGILLALQVNNWNEGKNLKRKEYNLLLEVQQNLKRNLQTLNGELRMENRRLQTINNIIDDLQMNQENDSLGQWIRVIGTPEQLNLTPSAYESIKSFGFDLIESQSLRNEIMLFFGTHYPTSKEIVTTFAADLLAKYSSYMIKYTTKVGGRITVRNYQQLRSDQDFLSLLYLRQDFKKNGYTYHNKSLSRACEQLLDQIDRELASFN